MIIWISSYPKSGNTWVRAFLCAYLYSSDGKFNFNLLNNIGEFPDHNILKKFVDSNNFHQLKEISKHWLSVQEFINLNKKFIFLKTHSSLCNINGNEFTNPSNTLAFIYIVRDPRNVVTSLSNYFGLKLEDAIKNITNPSSLIYAGKNDVVSIVGSWSQHYNSWKNTKNLYLIKYEDLIKNTYIEINKLFLFLKKECNLSINNNINNINEIIESTSFEKLKNMENQKLLNLSAQNGKNFFYLGKENKWENILDKKFTKDIEKSFKYEMTELGYL